MNPSCVADPDATPAQSLQRLAGARVGGQSRPGTRAAGCRIRSDAPPRSSCRRRGWRAAECGVSPKAAPQRRHRSMQGAVAAVDGDQRRGLGAQRRHLAVQLLEACGANTRALPGDERLELRRDPRVAPVCPRPRVDEDARSGSARRRARAVVPAVVGAVVVARAVVARHPRRLRSLPAILGYQRSNTSAIWRACFSFEMLKEDCLR